MQATLAWTQSQAPAHCFWHFYLFCFYFLRYLSTDSGSHLFLLAACTKSYIRKDPHGGDYCKMNPYVHTVPCISIHPDFWDAFLYHIWILRSLLVLLGKVAQALKSCHRSDSLCSVLCLDHSNTFRFLVLNNTSVCFGPSTLINYPVPPDEKLSHVMMLLLPCFTVVMVFLGVLPPNIVLCSNQTKKPFQCLPSF